MFECKSQDMVSRMLDAFRTAIEPGTLDQLMQFVASAKHNWQENFQD